MRWIEPDFSRSRIAKLIPMKRELKGTCSLAFATIATIIAKLIPMKRELKATDSRVSIRYMRYRKADPDEKGTERTFCAASPSKKWSLNRKADPDEKGTESRRSGTANSWNPQDRKADPDEKGTESWVKDPTVDYTDLESQS